MLYTLFFRTDVTVCRGQNEIKKTKIGDDLYNFCTKLFFLQKMPKSKKATIQNGSGGKKSRAAVSCSLQPFYQDQTGCVAAFSRISDIHTDQLIVGQEPFRYCVMRHLLEDAFLPGLRQELAGLRMRQKSNDLYQFRQSGELNRSAGPCVAALRETLLNHVKPILSQVTLRVFFNFESLRLL
jgi:hypothetical protein